MHGTGSWLWQTLQRKSKLSSHEYTHHCTIMNNAYFPTYRALILDSYPSAYDYKHLVKGITEFIEACVEGKTMHFKLVQLKVLSGYE